ncbi:WGxxGxxG family protein [Streptomyces sp. NPDC006610]|uniref:WGxxGxxG family protein n=1 Tax=Streptomyces sp. NPDC006610 TaxID=3154584 RepID=UPI0033A970D4
MRKLVGTALIALVLALAPAGTAMSQNASVQTPPLTTATVQAQQNQNEDDDMGLWGLLGLLGLLGLIPWRKNRDRDRHQGPTRSTGM